MDDLKALTNEELKRLTHQDRQLLGILLRKARVTRDVHKEFEAESTFGQRLSDKVAVFGGSWTFIIIFASMLIGWCVLNTVVLVSRAFDPYPYIFLNLVLSTVAALQAPVIMMSQNRQSAKDRTVSQHDYEVNLKAEVEIMALHEKMDELRLKQFTELMHVQERQLEMLRQVVASDRS
jgi:uncharacterized membrane protein